VIAEPLRSLARPIGEFRLLDGNPRRGDVASVKRSLQRFGQRKPIVVRADGTVEAGNTTLKAALELGWAEIAVVAFADDEATAKAFALTDNRTSELGAFDEDALAVMVAEVHAIDPELLKAASYTEADLNRLMANFGPGDGEPPRLDELAPRYCPKCGYDVANDPEALKV
jgi:ParB-like chromosome segregation protein Spo0J